MQKIYNIQDDSHELLNDLGEVIQQRFKRKGIVIELYINELNQMCVFVSILGFKIIDKVIRLKRN